MNLEGSLETFGLPDILTLLATTGKTGDLVLRTGPEIGLVRLDAGGVTLARAGCGDRTLLGRLVDSGALDDPGLEQLLQARRREPATGVLRLIREHALVAEPALAGCAAQAAADAVAELLRWSAGSFTFQAGAPDDEPTGIRIDVADLIEQGQRRRSEWEHLDARVSDPASVPALTLTVPQGVSVEPQHWRVLALVDGRRSIGELTGLHGDDAFVVRALLAELLDRRLLRLLEGGDEALSQLLRRHQILTELAGTGGEDPVEKPDAEGATGRDEQDLVEPDRTLLAPAATADDGRLPPALATSHAGPEVYAGADAAVMATTSVNGSLAMAQRPDPVVVGEPGLAEQPEEDAAVTRSLLLRLIAGVRTL
jgi:hypothetical protein